jgi:RNA polymerase sigma-70 factor (ECF subfamily)
VPDETATPPTDTKDPDLEWVRRAQAGDESAFGDLVRAHYESAFRTALSILRHEHDARDVVQDVWIVVWKKLAAFRGDAKFSTWLHPIIVRRALDHLRKRRRWFDRFLPFQSEGDEPDSSGDRIAAAAEPVAEETPRDDMEKAERNQRFERALATLPPKHRTVLTLREIQGLSYEEIAGAMKCKTGTVMSRLFHARRLLVRKLKELPCD